MSLHRMLRAAAGNNSGPAPTPGDLQFSKVALLLHGDGTNGAQNNTFVDSSSNAFAITRWGNATQGSFSPFPVSSGIAYSSSVNGGSAFFDGNYSGITAANNAAFNLGSGNFTLECWVYNKEVSTQCGIAGVWNGSFIIWRAGTTYRFYYGGISGSPLTCSIPAVLNSWQHLAIVRNGTTLTFYVNGVSGGSANLGTSAINFTSDPFGFGANFEYGSIGYPYIGFISNVRLVKGTAVYTANFTPPTSPLTAISGTAILLNFTNAGIYDNAAKSAVQTVGNAQISTAVKKFGTGSLAFDGTGDGLIANASAAPLVNTDFTWEVWVNFNSLSGAPCLLNVGTSSANRTLLYFDPTNGIRYAVARSGIDQISIQQGSTSGWSTGTWYHVALVRSGNTYTIYRDGTSVATGTSTYSQSILPDGMNVGYSNSSGSYLYLNGYIDDVRITNGFARYTANFPPPNVAFLDQ